MSASSNPVPRQSDDRRRTPRIENRGRLLLQLLSDDAPVTLYDFSAGGFSLLSPRSFDAGERHRFRIGPRNGPFVLVTARVAYCRRYSRHRHGDEHFVGLAFEGLDQAHKTAIDKLLDVLTATLSFE